MSGSEKQSATLIQPPGGSLVDLLPEGIAVEELEQYGNTLPSVRLSRRSVCDLEILSVGGFSPLDTFIGQEDYKRVLGEMRLAGGDLWPIPVTLPIDRAENLHLDRDIALRDSGNELLAIMTIEEIFDWRRDEFSQAVFGTQDFRHPLVAEMQRWGERNVSGKLRVVRLPSHHDFVGLRLAPRETRNHLKQLGRANVVALQTRNPLHRAHEEMATRAIKAVEGVLLMHPVIGLTKTGDVDNFTRVRTYKALASNYFQEDRVLLALLPLAMRFAGPREALWHALIRRNYGANHLIVGRDHASPGLNSKGEAFYEPYEAQTLVESFEGETGVRVLRFEEFVYLPKEERFVEASEVPEGVRSERISGTALREGYLDRGRELPDWYARPEVAKILRDVHPPRHRQGFCVWLTGLSGAGKSTTAEVLTSLLLENGRQITLLDGDVVRTHLSKGLGYSKEDRDTNIRRIGFVAAEIVRHGGAVICAAVSPYRATRNDVRAMVGSELFIEAFVDTPLEICEERDTKGLYMRARRGEIKGLTGIDDPYEPPENPEIRLDTLKHSAVENAILIRSHLLDRGLLQYPQLDDIAVK